MRVATVQVAVYSCQCCVVLKTFEERETFSSALSVTCGSLALQEL